MKIKIEISEEQIAYLKSLDSKKKKRKFLLDCLLGEIESKNKVKFKPIIFKDGVFETKDKNVADFLRYFCRESKLVEETELKEIVSKQVDELFKDGKEIPTDSCKTISGLPKQPPILTGNPMTDSISIGISAIGNIREAYKAMDERKEILENSVGILKIEEYEKTNLHNYKIFSSEKLNSEQIKELRNSLIQIIRNKKAS